MLQSGRDAVVEEKERFDNHRPRSKEETYPSELESLLYLNENGLKWTSNQRCLRAADAWDEYCYNLNENKQRAKFFDHRN